METRGANNSDFNSRSQAYRCEIIQEIHGFGTSYLLSVSDEDVCRRLVLKYQRRLAKFGVSNLEMRSLENLIRDTLFERRIDLGTASNKVAPRKELVISAAARAASGTLDRAR